MGMARGDDPPVVLVADDDPGIRDVLAAMLSDDGYRALVAADGDEALALADSDPPDVILLDLVMPLFDAAGFCRTYRERGGTAPVVLISAAPPDDVEAAVAPCGAASWILKPFDVDVVLRTVRCLVARRSQLSGRGD
jgi:DNA-binding response OmpR family regulator